MSESDRRAQADWTVTCYIASLRHGPLSGSEAGREWRHAACPGHVVAGRESLAPCQCPCHETLGRDLEVATRGPGRAEGQPWAYQSYRDATTEGATRRR